MNKNSFKTVVLEYGLVNIYEVNDIKLYAYKTNDLMADEVFIIEKGFEAFSIEQPCFVNNIKELEKFIKNNGINLVAKLIAYHGAGGSFMSKVTTYGTKSSIEYNSVGGGAALINKFIGAFKEAFDPTVDNKVFKIEDGINYIAGLKVIIESNIEAYDIKIPELNCVYTHMLGHDCHSIVAGVGHANGLIKQLSNYLDEGFDLVLTSHFTPEDQKDVKAKIAYLKEVKEIANVCHNKEEMKKELLAKYPEYSGLNYLDMTVGFFFHD